MPTYEFECVDCDEIKVVVQSIHIKVADQTCEKCGYAMARKFTNPGVIFNASGFYGTGG